MTRTRATRPSRRRSREWLGVLAVIALAGGSGLIAAHFGTHRSWEKAPAASTSTSRPLVDPQRTP